MNLLISLNIPGPPVPKARARVTRRGGTYTPPRTVEAEKRIAEYCRARYPTLVPSIARLRMVCHFGTKGARGDGDNFLKLAADALAGLVYVNDSQIDQYDITVDRYALPPVTRIEVYEL